MEIKIIDAAGVAYSYPEELGSFRDEFKGEELVAMAALANSASELSVVKKARESVDLHGEPVLTFPMCLLAVRHNARELRHVPASLKSEEVCLTAFQFGKLSPSKKSIGVGFDEQTKFRPLLSLLPKKLDNMKFYLKILSTLDVRDPYGHENLVRDAFTAMIERLQEKGIAIKDADDDDELTLSERDVVDFCREAVRICPSLIREVPLRYATEETFRVAVDKNGSLLLDIRSMLAATGKQNDIPDVLWETALESSLSVIRYLPVHLASPQTIVGCLERGKDKGKDIVERIIPVIPEENWSQELFDHIFARCGKQLDAEESFIRIPEKYFTHDFCVRVASNNWRIFKAMPDNFRDREVCEAVVKSYLWSIRDVPEHLRDERMYRFLLDCHSYGAVAEVPEQFLDRDICWKIIDDATQKDNVGGHMVDEVSTLCERVKGSVTSEKKCLQLLKLARDAYGYNAYSDFVAEYIPDDLKTDNVCLSIVEPYIMYGQRCEQLVKRHVPDARKTAVYEAIFRTNKLFQIADVEKRFWSPELFLLALESDPHNIRDIPKEYWGWITDGLPENLREETQKLMLLHTRKQFIRKFGELRPEEWKPEILFDVFTCERMGVEKETRYVDLSMVAPEMKTGDFYEKMVEANPFRVADVPEDMLTPAICEKAVKEYGSLVKKIPDSVVTEDLWVTAILAVPLLQEEMPERFRTASLYNRLADGGINPEYVPEEFRSKEFYFRAAASDAITNWQGIPADIWDREFVETAFRTDHSLERMHDILAATPFENVGRDILRTAAEYDGRIIKGFPACFITEEIAEIAIRQDAKNFLYVPPYLRSREMCELALQTSSNAHDESFIFENIPINVLTPSMCRKAMENPRVEKKNIPVFLVSEKEEAQTPVFRL